MTTLSTTTAKVEGILLLNKPQGITSFGLVHVLRQITGVRKIGHAGTLDPFATGVMIMLIGKNYTRISQYLIISEKEYLAKVYLGKATTTYDPEGEVTHTSSYIPSIEEVQSVLNEFQGEIEQIPPMFSAKRHKGEKLYNLARKGIHVERPPQKVTVTTTLLNYSYPYLNLHVKCSKGTYIRSLTYDIGNKLGTHAFLENLSRESVASYKSNQCYSLDYIKEHGVKSEMLFTHPHANT